MSPGDPLRTEDRNASQAAITARMPTASDHSDVPGAGTDISHARIASALATWALTEKGPFTIPVDGQVTVDEARAALRADPRISELACASGVDRHLEGALTTSSNPEVINQFARNAVRVERLLRFYEKVCGVAGDPDLAVALASKLGSSGVTAALVNSTFDENFDARYQASLLPLYVGERQEVSSDSRLHEVLKAGTSAGLVPAVVERELRGQAFMLFVGAASIGITQNYPSWTNNHGWDGRGLDLAYAFKGGAYDMPWSSSILSNQLQRPELQRFQEIVLEAALWGTYETGQDYDTVRRAACQLQYDKAFPAMNNMRAGLQQGLDIFGRDPTKRHSDWFGTRQTEKLTRSAAERLGDSLQRACDEENLGEVLLAFHAFERRANPTRASSGSIDAATVTSMLRSLARQGITHENAASFPREVMGAAAAMLLYANRQSIPAGYYIHADTAADASSGFRFTRFVAGPVVGQRFVKGPDGKEFDQIIVDAKYGMFGYDMPGTINIPIRINYVHQQYDRGGNLVGEWNGGHADLTYEFRARFCTVFLPDVTELADTLQVDARALFDVVADHEADHGYVRRDPDVIGIDSNDWVDRYVATVEHYAPHLSEQLTEELGNLDRDAATPWIASTILEMSAIIREATRDSDAHRKMRQHLDDGTVPTCYKVPCEVIAGALSLNEGGSASESLNQVYRFLFGKPLPTLEAQWLVLPSNRHRIP